MNNLKFQIEKIYHPYTEVYLFRFYMSHFKYSELDLVLESFDGDILTPYSHIVYSKCIKITNRLSKYE